MSKSTRTRKWFLTINKEANSFNNLKTILQELSVVDKNGDKKLEYSAMLHNQDNEEQPHYHVVLAYKDTKTFEQVQKHFDGAHIEQVESMYKVCRYLLHMDDLEKYQYSMADLITNCNQVEYYSEHDEHEKLEQESLMSYIQDGTIYNITTACKKYGIKQVNLYRNLITTLLEESKNQDMQNAMRHNYEMGYNTAYEMMEKVLDEKELEHNTEIMVLEREIEKLKEIIKKYTNNNLLS